MVQRVFGSLASVLKSWQAIDWDHAPTSVLQVCAKRRCHQWSEYASHSSDGQCIFVCRYHTQRNILPFYHLEWVAGMLHSYKIFEDLIVVKCALPAVAAAEASQHSLASIQAPFSGTASLLRAKGRCVALINIRVRVAFLRRLSH